MKHISIIKVILKSRIMMLLFIMMLIPNLSYSQDAASTILLKVQDAVFTVYAELDNGISQGSGFFIDSTGIGITNYHVLERANNAHIITRTGQEYEIARIVDYDAEKDLVKFKVKNISNIYFKYLKIQTAPPQGGSTIYSLSTPLGLGQTLTTGIISALRNDDTHGDIIQITAPISHGSSGSPVINAKGEVVGVSTFTLSEGQNLNFAVASRQIKEMRKNLNITVAEMGRDPLETENVRTARRLFQQGNYEDAMNHIMREINNNPQNHIALYTASRFIYRTLPSAKADRQASIICLLFYAYQASLIKTDCAAYYCQIGLGLTALGIENNWEKDENGSPFDAAISAYQKSLEYDSLHTDALYGIAKTLCEASRPNSTMILSFTPEKRIQNYKIAIDILQQLEQFNPCENYYNYLIIANMDLHEFGKAILYCDKLIAFNPDYYRGYSLRGDIKIFDMDMFNEGILDLERALALCEDNYYKADILALRSTAYAEKAFKERKDMGSLIHKAVKGYEKAYEITQNPIYKKLKDDLIERANNNNIMKGNLFK